MTGKTKILEVLLKLAYQQAHQVLIEQQLPKLLAIFVLVQADGNVVLVPYGGDNDGEAPITAAEMRVLMRKTDTVAYSLVTEAWAAPRPADRISGQAVEWRMLERPDHPDIVMAYVSDGTDSRHRCWQIIRDGERVMALVPETEHSEIVGGFTDLLSKPV